MPGGRMIYWRTGLLHLQELSLRLYGECTAEDSLLDAALESLLQLDELTIVNPDRDQPARGTGKF